MTPNIELININCLKYLEATPEAHFDCCIADPPYGINFQSSWKTEKSKRKEKILNDELPFVEWIAPLYSKIKTGGRLICFYRWDVQDQFLHEIESAGFTVKSQVVWDKVSHGMGDLSGEFAPQHELMIYATKGRYTFKGNRPKSVYRSMRVMPEELVHPNEKPVNLLSAIVRDITEEGELVYDPFGGSFTTAIACNLNRRHCVSNELHSKYFNIGLERYRLKTSQLNLI